MQNYFNKLENTAEKIVHDYKKNFDISDPLDADQTATLIKLVLMYANLNQGNITEEEAEKIFKKLVKSL